MAFKKGNKLGKSRKGKLNKRTVETLKRAEKLLCKLDETIEVDIDSLEPKERANLWKDLLEYTQPKLARIESDVNVATTLTVNIKPLDE